MTEEFLYYVWLFKLYKKDLISTNGESITILSPGIRNSDSGPDFFNAKIKIGETLWSGNVEMHLNSSDWDKHKHQFDPAYNNVILHVVYENDKEVKNEAGNVLCQLEMKSNILSSAEWNYQKLINNNKQILCSEFISDIDNITWIHWKERLLLQRLERKVSYIKDLFEYKNKDWNATFYILLAKYFGQKINQLPFELLAKSIDFNVIQKCIDSPLKIEALVFGQAGMLENDFVDEYPKQLKAEYKFLRKKYQLGPIDKSLWKFLRLRPVNFPTIRLAQFSVLLMSSGFLFSKIRELNTIKDLREIFNFEVHEYWNTHFQFDKESRFASKKIGKSFIDVILINVIIPLLFFYGKESGENKYEEYSLKLLEETKAEKNNITSKWEDQNLLVQSAYDSQSLIELYNEYCSKKRCLNCEICMKILSR